MVKGKKAISRTRLLAEQAHMIKYSKPSIDYFILQIRNSKKEKKNKKKWI